MLEIASFLIYQEESSTLLNSGSFFQFFYVEKLLQSAKVVVLPENQYMF